MNGAAGEWSGRQVLVTGYSGFIGSWLTSALLQQGVHVTGFARDEDEHCTARARSLAERGVATIAGDIRDFSQVYDAMASRPFHTVFHLAAQPLVRVGLEQPWMTLTTNIGGTLNVLEAARLCQPAVLVHVTSDKCYRNHGRATPYREADELGGSDPYRASKAAAELAFAAYTSVMQADRGPVHAASVRLANVIGGGDHADRLVPNAIAAWEAEAPVVIYQPQAVRPWQHVLDVVLGLLLLAEGLAAGTVADGEVFNFAPPSGGAPVEALIQELADAWICAGEAAPPVAFTPGRRFAEDVVLRLDGRKAATALNWTHRLDLPSAAESVVAWRRLVKAGHAPLDATASQVNEFLGAMAHAPAEARAGLAP